MEIFVIVQGVSPSENQQNAFKAHTAALIQAKTEMEGNKGRTQSSISTFPLSTNGDFAFTSYVFFNGVPEDFDANGSPTFQTLYQVNGDIQSQ